MRKHAFQMVVSVLSMFLLCISFLAWTFPRDLLPSAGSVAAIPEPPPSPSAASPTAEPEPQPVVQTVRFSATGDNLIHSPIYKQAKRRAAGTEGYSFDYCYEHIAPFYAQQDVNWINQGQGRENHLAKDMGGACRRVRALFPELVDSGTAVAR